MQRYRALIASGRISPDPVQALAAEKLQLLSDRLGRAPPPRTPDFFSFFSRLRKAPSPPEGLYMFGAVGRGKTMLMDLFHESVAFRPRRRLHFHEFMAEVHDTIARLRKAHEGDPLPLAASIIAAEAPLLCLDELQVTDITDAMILGRLFTGLFAANVAVVATSNAAPRDLYKDGLNRALFLPFIKQIEQRMEPLELASAHDYRLEKLDGVARYFTPLGEKARAGVQEAWERLTGEANGQSRSRSQELIVKGRKVVVPRAAMGVARFRFDDLCRQPLGANDYLMIAHHFHTVIIEGIPALGPDDRNEARRFITLIDTLYDAGVGLIASAEAQPAGLYPEGDGAVMFERTASRLMEMRSEGYPPAERNEGGCVRH
jgi:cell division protein ZapE